MLTNILNKVRQVPAEPDLNRHSERVATQDLYVSAAADRVAEMTIGLRAQITEELRIQFNAELEARVASMQCQPQPRSEEGQDVPLAGPPELAEEIAASQAELLRKESELAKSLSDDTSLGAISRLRAEIRELAAYLRGLNFALDRR